MITLTIPPCGDTISDPKAEERYKAVRAEQGDTGDDGCGIRLTPLTAYRCVDCARWLCMPCIVQHFARHGDRLRQIEQAANEFLDTNDELWRALNEDRGQGSFAAGNRMDDAVERLYAACGRALGEGLSHLADKTTNGGSGE